ncbi:MAG: OsmC family protein [Pseudomonadota bacterium]
MTHVAEIYWQAEGNVAAGEYSRAHTWGFDGGAEVAASASPDIVPVPLSQPEAVDPEEGFVAALASCHMLWFLDFARRAGFVPESYTDHAVGHMEQTEDGGLWVARVDLTPYTVWSGAAPSEEEETALHAKAHASCFIARSVKTEIVVRVNKYAEALAE